ncbi:hypothetical protein [Modicisalibacter xianhensis]|uniref:hypothetical protein n=1 Tax=Modicisalibacter xianhensis TaxID=442341 RepID=UPI001416EE00|nr:hypothetical protein [Halomonas xianhensis]
MYEKLPSFLRRFLIVAKRTSPMYQIAEALCAKFVPTHDVKQGKTTVNMNSHEKDGNS